MQKKPENCPECGSGEVKKIFYGQIEIRTEEEHQKFTKNYIWGGRKIDENYPIYYCTACYHRWGGKKFPLRCPKCKGSDISEFVAGIMQCKSEEDLKLYQEAFHMGERLPGENRILVKMYRCGTCGCTFETGGKRPSRKEIAEGSEDDH